MTIADQEKNIAGALNLLRHCADCKAGQTILIVYEQKGLGFYADELKDHIAIVASGLGVRAKEYQVAFDPAVVAIDAELQAAVDGADHVIFFARIGDQLRFKEHTDANKLIVSYALDLEMLESNFGVARYDGFRELKRLTDVHLRKAKNIRVTCPLGTDFSGALAVRDGAPTDATVKRFPMSVFSPILATGFSGRIAQTGFLVGTGSTYYAPYACALEGTIFVHFKDNRIIDFEGSDADVAVAQNHYGAVGSKLGIDPDFVHSWHVGIHPGCGYGQQAGQNFERWSGGAFGNPRLLHFHTCGAYAPGEISLNVLDPTVSVDGVDVWNAGQFFPNRVPGGQKILDDYSCIDLTFSNPAHYVGQGGNGQLSYQVA